MQSGARNCYLRRLTVTQDKVNNLWSYKIPISTVLNSNQSISLSVDTDSTQSFIHRQTQLCSFIHLSFLRVGTIGMCHLPSPKSVGTRGGGAMLFSNAASFPVRPERTVTMSYAAVLLIGPWKGCWRLYPRKAVKVPWRIENMSCAWYSQRRVWLYR